MAKPMLVTLPLVLWLLDFWPLKRLAGRPMVTAQKSRLLLEKVPLLLLAAASCAVTLWAQDQAGAVASVDLVPVGARIQNAVAAYAGYLALTVWPGGLVPFYPYSMQGLSLTYVVAASLLLATITALSLWWTKRYPYLGVGWLWYVGALVPVIGLVQVGRQAMADRYTYLPSIGLYLMIAWGLADVAASLRFPREAAVGAAGSVLVGFAILSWVQVGYWRDSRTLWEHAVKVSPANSEALNNLGHSLTQEGKLAEAARCFAAALEAYPGHAEAHNNLGRALADMGRWQEAVPHFREALRLQPTYAKAHDNLGLALLRLNDVVGAIANFREAARLNPRSTAARLHLGLVLGRAGNWPAAAECCREAVGINPTSVEAHTQLGWALYRQGRITDAIEEYAAAIKAGPDQAPAYEHLGIALSSLGREQDALGYFEKAVQLQPAEGAYHYDLAYALALLGQAESSRAQYALALRLSPAWPEGADREARELLATNDAAARETGLALRLAQEACAATGNRKYRFLETLAAAQAQRRQYRDAAITTRQALKAASGVAPEDVVRGLAERLQSYEAAR
jgi:tetratricopeptide (TPR) repeat protein